MTSPITRPAPRFEAHTVIGYPDEIARIIAANRANGRLVATSGPVDAPAGDGRIIVELQLRPAARVHPDRPVVRVQPPRRPAAVPASNRRPVRRRITLRVALAVGVGVTALAGAVLYTAVRLLLAAFVALAAHADLLVGTAFVVLVVVAAVVKRCVCPTCGRS
jgi:hypothetical protein